MLAIGFRLRITGEVECNTDCRSEGKYFRILSTVFPPCIGLFVIHPHEMDEFLMVTTLVEVVAAAAMVLLEK